MKVLGINGSHRAGKGTAALLQAALDGFIEMRKAIEKPLTDRALSMVLNKLDKLAGAHAG